MNTFYATIATTSDLIAELTFRYTIQDGAVKFQDPPFEIGDIMPIRPNGWDEYLREDLEESVLYDMNSKRIEQYRKQIQQLNK